MFADQATYCGVVEVEVVEETKEQLGFRTKGRDIEESDEVFALREGVPASLSACQPSSSC
jgi:hypothetical protein